MLQTIASLVFAATVAATPSATGSEVEALKPTERVSVLSIALHCPPLDGHRVTIIGALSLGFEDQSICPTNEFFHGDLLNCLWVATDETFNRESLKTVAEDVSKGTYVLMEGTVSCTNQGFGGLYGAAIERITLIVANDEGRVVWSTDPALSPVSAEEPPSGKP